MTVIAGFMLGAMAYFGLRLLRGVYTVQQNERAVKTRFGRVVRLNDASTLEDPIAKRFRDSEKQRYNYPQVKVWGPGGPFVAWPWEKVHKVSIATNTVNIAYDPESPTANSGGKQLAAVTKDQLDTGIVGQLRYRVSERNLYAYLFGVKNPIAHVMGFFISILRERIATFEAPELPPLDIAIDGEQPPATAAIGISINDLRKNLRAINEHMESECGSSAARYGVELDATLITEIDPPHEVETALAAINTAHNHVSSELSLAQAGADQTIVLSKRAVEIETLKAEAEVEPILKLAEQLRALKTRNPDALKAYVRNTKLELFARARNIILESGL